jgi:transketolase
LIIVDSHIAYGAPNKQNTSAAHGEPLGEEEIKGAKRHYGWPEDAKFLVPDGVYDHFRNGIGKRGKELRDAWFTRVGKYKAKYPELAEQLYRMQHRQLPEGWDKDIPTFAPDAKGMATRDASGKLLNAIGKNVPWLMGGSADLGPSCKTRLTFDGAGDFEADNPGGRNLHFGIREHAMAAVLNGMALVKVRAFGSTFLIFSDYARAAIRLSALMELPVIYVFTHDSIGVGEDGPTHQPIEQVASLRAIPGLIVLRPADANETAEAWKVIMKLHHEPAALILTRQALPTIDRSKYASASGLAHGAYVLADAADGKPDVLLLASGSEVVLCLEAFERLKAEGIKARVVSVPSWELFDDQPQEYRDRVLPPDVTARVSVEQASTFGWAKYAGATGHRIGMRSFGASAPLKDLVKKFGFTAEQVVGAAKEQLRPSGSDKEVSHDHRRTGTRVGAERFSDRSGFRPRCPSFRQGPRRTPSQGNLPHPRGAHLGGDRETGPARGHSAADSRGGRDPGPDRRWSGRGGRQPRLDQGLRPGAGPREDRRRFFPPVGHPGWRGKTRPAAGNARQVAGRGDAVRLAPVRAPAG